MKLSNRDFLNMSEDDFDSVDELSRNKISRKEIKSTWQSVEDGLNTHNSKSVSRYRKW